MRLLLQFAFSCLHNTFRPWSKSVDVKKKVSAESVDARSVCRGSDHTYMFWSSKKFMHGWHYTQKTAAYSCRLPEKWPMHNWTLPDCLHPQSILFMPWPPPLPLHGWDSKRGVQHRQQHAATEQNNSPLGLVRKSWGWGGNEEVTGFQHSAVSFDTTQLYGFILTFPSDLRKGTRAPSFLGSRWKLRSSSEIDFVLGWQHSTEMSSDDSGLYISMSIPTYLCISISTSSIYLSISICMYINTHKNP